ncbi:hypothetical protein VH567_13370 [Sphingomonas sp. 4RDLI-65]
MQLAIECHGVQTHTVADALAVPLTATNCRPGSIAGSMLSK